MEKFKKGDIVERVHDSRMNESGFVCLKSNRYTVERFLLTRSVVLKELPGIWDAEKFKLVNPKKEIINSYSIF